MFTNTSKYNNESAHDRSINQHLSSSTTIMSAFIFNQIRSKSLSSISVSKIKKNTHNIIYLFIDIYYNITLQLLDEINISFKYSFTVSAWHHFISMR